MEVAPGVRRLLAPNPGMMTGAGTNTWLLGRNEVVVVDPGPALPVHLDAIIAAAGTAKIVAVWLTHAHPDHAEAVSAIVTRTLCAYRAWPTPAPTYAIADLPDPMPIADGDVLTIDGDAWTAIHTPGHASDHLCFFRAADGVLLTGDVVVGEGTVVIAPPDGNLRHYLASLDRLAALNATVVMPGHGAPIDNPRAKIAAYTAHRHMREKQVVTALASGHNTVDALVAAIYPDLDARLARIAAKQMHGHLLKLADEDRAWEFAGRWTLAAAQS